MDKLSSQFNKSRLIKAFRMAVTDDSAQLSSNSFIKSDCKMTIYTKFLTPSKPVVDDRTHFLLLGSIRSFLLPNLSCLAL